MPAPTIIDLLDRLVVVLGPATINGASPYTLAVVTCELQGRIWSQVADAERPYIGVQLMGGDNQEAMARQVFETFDIRLVCHLPSSADLRARMVAQQELLDDIYTAFDVGTGGYSLNRTNYGLKIRRWTVDAGDPLAANASVVNTLHVFLEAKIRRTPGAS